VWGPADGLQNSCPIVQPHASSGWCETDAPTQQLYAGTSGGAGSRCVLSTLSSEAYQVQISGANCYMTQCTDAGTLQVSIKGAKGAAKGTYDCPVAGGELQVPGYTGSLECPPSEELCGREADARAAAQAMTDPAALRFKGSLPRAGHKDGGTAVRIFGRGFSAAGDIAVRFGAADAAVITVIDDEEMEVVSPAGAAGTVDIAMTMASGADTGYGAFTYTDTGPVDTRDTAIELVAGSPVSGGGAAFEDGSPVWRQLFFKVALGLGRIILVS
jgi:hypothetical protein